MSIFEIFIILCAGVAMQRYTESNSWLYWAWIFIVVDFIKDILLHYVNK